MKNLIKQLLREELKNTNNIYTLFHGTDRPPESLIKPTMFFASSYDYAKLWGSNVYKVNIKLDRIFDSTDLGKKKLNYKQFIKYLINKGMDKDSEIFYYIEKKMDDDLSGYSFWWWLTQSGFNWLAHDILNSGPKYDAIKLSEYGHSYKEKDETYYVDNPKNKIIDIIKL